MATGESNRGKSHSALWQNSLIIGLPAILYFGGALGASILTKYLTLIALLALGGLVLFPRLSEGDFPDWVILNIIAILLALYIASSTALVLPLWALFWLIVGITLFDYMATHRKGSMTAYLKFLIENRVPAFVVVPVDKGFTFREFRESMLEQDKDDSTDVNIPACTMLGIGDLVVPTALAISVATNTAIIGSAPPLAIGIAAGGLIGVMAVRILDPEVFGALIFIGPGSIGGMLIAATISNAPVPSLAPAFII